MSAVCRQFIVPVGIAQQHKLSKPKRHDVIGTFSIPNDDSRQLLTDEAAGASGSLDRFGRKPAMHPARTHHRPLRKQNNIRPVRTRKTKNAKIPVQNST